MLSVSSNAMQNNAVSTRFSASAFPRYNQKKHKCSEQTNHSLHRQRKDEKEFGNELLLFCVCNVLVSVETSHLILKSAHGQLSYRLVSVSNRSVSCNLVVLVALSDLWVPRKYKHSICYKNGCPSVCLSHSRVMPNLFIILKYALRHTTERRL